MTETDKAIQRHFAFSGRNRNLPWYPRRGNRHDLAHLFATLGFMKGVEVGTCTGEFAEVLCAANPSLHLCCVDPWSEYSMRSQETQDRNHLEAQRRLEDFNCVLIRSPSLDAVGSFQDGALDFVFIDGNHLFDHAMRDIIEWSAKVRDGGIVAVHDYHPFTGSDVMLAVDAYTRAHHIDPWYVTREMEPTAYWVRRTPPVNDKSRY